MVTPSELQGNLIEARKGLWELIRFHQFRNFSQAEAAVKAYNHVQAALELCEKQLSQLPLPVPVETAGKLDEAGAKVEPILPRGATVPRERR